MITFANYVGFFLLILVGYHYINEPLGFSIAGSIATAIFATCIASLYQGYEPDRKNWLGWGLISSGCLILASFSSFKLLLLAPVILIIIGFRWAELPFDWHSAGGGDGGMGGDGGFDCGGGEGGG
ncbi:MAG: hypothetical protein KZQ83_12425 [gamma proteobacterium symbiont of Taylorina sp.]|nr:hypothetical protein [gamma proteobacterium symbiont of Taylorina sp.]